jgi:uncharacterized membrane-anchored protein
MKVFGFFALMYAALIALCVGYYFTAAKIGVLWFAYIERTTREQP